MKIAISAESTIDLPKELLEKHDIHILPFTVILGERSAYDGDITPNDIFRFVKDTGKLPKTAAINQSQYFEHFTKLKKEYDAIIHLSLSSKISSSYQNAVNAAANVEKVRVIDSRSLSTGIALLAYYAEKLVKEGKTLDEVVNLVKERRNLDQTSFILEKVNFLYKGGRCSLLSFIGANLLGIKPQILVKEGAMKPGKKYRGNIKIATIKYVKDTLEQFNNPDLSQVFITYTTADKDLVDEIKEILKERGFENIEETTAGATITSHCGEHCLGILYLCNK